MPLTNNPSSPIAAGGAAPVLSAGIKQALAQRKADGTDDGSAELAIAIAAVSPKVTVTAPALTVAPDDLFELTFNDPKVGITSDAQMQAVKDKLSQLRPDIAADLAQIQNDPTASIEDVQESVRLALLASRG